ncbi:MAG TPA: hypothetical protein VGG46_01295 [Terriglobales bacterium]
MLESVVLLFEEVRFELAEVSGERAGLSHPVPAALHTATKA